MDFILMYFFVYVLPGIMGFVFANLLGKYGPWPWDERLAIAVIWIAIAGVLFFVAVQGDWDLTNRVTMAALFGCALRTAMEWLMSHADEAKAFPRP